MKKFLAIFLGIALLFMLTACNRCQHTYTEKVLKPVSFTADGQTQKICSKCGDVQTVTVPMLETPVEYQVLALETYEDDSRCWVEFDLDVKNISQRRFTVVMGDMTISDGTDSVTLAVVFPHPIAPGGSLYMPDFSFTVNRGEMALVEQMLKQTGFENLTFDLVLTEVHYQD